MRPRRVVRGIIAERGTRSSQRRRAIADVATVFRQWQSGEAPAGGCIDICKRSMRKSYDAAADAATADWAATRRSASRPPGSSCVTWTCCSLPIGSTRSTVTIASASRPSASTSLNVMRTDAKDRTLTHVQGAEASRQDVHWR